MDVLGFPQADYPRVDTGELALKPFDARLVRYAPAARTFLVAGAVLAVLRASGVILFTHGLAFGVTRFFGDSVAGYLVEALCGLVVLVMAQWGTDVLAMGMGNRVVSELRIQALGSFRQSDSRHSSEMAMLLSTGINAVAHYVSSFLPAVVSLAVFTPIVSLAIAVIDPLSGVAVAITLPLIPLFMALIGKATQTTQAAQWKALSQLSTGFSEIVSGVTTLMLFGREGKQSNRIRTITDDFRARTMKVLRLSFVSSFVLEVGSSLAVAVVAVSIGIRLINGDLKLDTGLWVLILVPEVFTAIRLVGARFHASADGLSVADSVFDIIETATPTTPRGRGRETLHVESASVTDRLSQTSFVAHHGHITVVVGPSGSGKSTLLDVIRGELATDGTVLLDGHTVSREDVAWSPQSPSLTGDTVFDAIRLGVHGEIAPHIVDDVLRRAAIDFDLTTPIVNLSGGQAQRVALARAFLRAETRGTALIVLDEPTSALDDITEKKVLDGIGETARRGHIIIVTSHREPIRAVANVVVDLA